MVRFLNNFKLIVIDARSVIIIVYGVSLSTHAKTQQNSTDFNHKEQAIAELFKYTRFSYQTLDGGICHGEVTATG